MVINASARAFLGISHSPLIGLNPVAQEVSEDLSQALKRAREAVTNWAPDRVVLIGPDHYNGFFNEMMPAFCVGTNASAIGDYGTPSGDLNVDADGALSVAEWLMDHDFDIAVSRRMRVDHGFSQPLQMLWGGLATPPVIPIFVNAVAQPTIPRLGRCKALGEAIGQWLDSAAGRTLLIGSGGLSHEPPVPTLDHPNPAVRARRCVIQMPGNVCFATTGRFPSTSPALAS